ncbi:uroporphyrin-iii c-methyltransferase [Bipolaris maydis]|nr:uroporphyrin-iii c-methyltransferase [Bipolaris maydis]
MSTAMWPPIDEDRLAQEQAASQARELEWLLVQLRETLQSLKAGLDECAALLAPSENGSTLVLTSVRSESLKGLITRIGTRITKGNIKLRLASLPPPKGSLTWDLVISSAPHAPTLVVPQLTSVRTSINSCLDAIDVATWGGDATNAQFVSGQLQLLHDHIIEAQAALKGHSPVQPSWWDNPVDENTFDPPLPANVSFHLFVFDAALVLEIRTLEPHNAGDSGSLTGFSIRNTFASALGGTRAPTHDEADRTFTYKNREVRVKEKIRVESQDPALISASAKLNALGHTVMLSRKALNIVMVDATSHIHLIVGSNPLAGARCTRSIEVGAKPILLAPEDATLHYGLAKRIEAGEVQWLKRSFQDEDLTTLGRPEVDGVVDAVFVTSGGKNGSATQISNLCRRLRIPVNVADAPNLCSFTLLSTHTDGPLQIGITTSGKGCKLSARIRREIAASLPPRLGDAVERLGALRRRIWEEDHAAELSQDLEAEEEDSGQPATFNKLILEESKEAARGRRMRWLTQICEYWPLRRLASITDADVNMLFREFASSSPSKVGPTATAPQRVGRIILAGSGPGNPDLLARAAHKAILSADLILADKLVPAPILDLVPRRATVHIARKFPGNADKAQEELLEMGLEGLKAGKVVVRIKQGDPYIYGRGGEEYDFFRAHGFIPSVLPGITSALSAPLFAAIPATHRGIADQVLICTGTGRKGAPLDPPEFVASRTLVLLMSLHRLSALVDSLVTKAYPADLPVAVLERASCPDQRVIRTTLEHVCAAVEEEGSRPPGLLVVGNACKVLMKYEQRWLVEEGFHGLDNLGGDGELEISRLTGVDAGAAPVAVA